MFLLYVALTLVNTDIPVTTIKVNVLARQEVELKLDGVVIHPGILYKIALLEPKKVIFSVTFLDGDTVVTKHFAAIIHVGRNEFELTVYAMPTELLALNCTKSGITRACYAL